jgi:hypothetical protein
MISDKCQVLASSLFNTWYFIDNARRYASVEEKEKALVTTINARAAVYDSGIDGALTESEVKALNDDLNTVIGAIEWREFSEASDRLKALSEQTFMHALQEVVKCECGGEG